MKPKTLFIIAIIFLVAFVFFSLALMVVVLDAKAPVSYSRSSTFMDYEKPYRISNKEATVNRYGCHLAKNGRYAVCFKDGKYYRADVVEIYSYYTGGFKWSVDGRSYVEITKEGFERSKR
jgi:hypothetical protein